MTTFANIIGLAVRLRDITSDPNRKSVIAFALRANPAMNDKQSPTSCQRVMVVGKTSVTLVLEAVLPLVDGLEPKSGNVGLVTTGYTYSDARPVFSTVVVSVSVLLLIWCSMRVRFESV